MILQGELLALSLILLGAFLARNDLNQASPAALIYLAGLAAVLALITGIDINLDRKPTWQAL